MKNYFVDTSFWKALVDRNDTCHKDAKAVFADLAGSSYCFYTSDLVFSETVTLLRMRAGLGHEVAKKWGDALLHSQTVVLLQIAQYFDDTWVLFKRYKDKSFSFVDCSSFIMMEKTGLSEALTFDRHFEQYGFQILPRG